jgi:hypothetical protein
MNEDQITSSWLNPDSTITVEWAYKIGEGHSITRTFRYDSDGLRQWIQNDRVPRLSRWSEPNTLTYWEGRYRGIGRALASPRPERYVMDAEVEIQAEK